MGSSDVLIVARLDRLGRSLQHLIEIVRDLDVHGVDFRSLAEVVDTTSGGDRLLFDIAAARSEFGRGLLRERILMGLAAAREQGRAGGRPLTTTPACS